MTPETFVRRQICAWLTAKGGFVFVKDSVGIWDPKRKVFRANIDPHRIKGVSDIIGIWEKRFLAIEVKVKGSYPSTEQKSFIEEIKKRGGIAFVAMSIEDVERELTLSLSE